MINVFPLINQQIPIEDPQLICCQISFGSKPKFELRNGKVEIPVQGRFMHACLWSEEREERGTKSYPPIPGSMTSATSPIILKWDPKSLEIRTLTVERLLEPLVTQVTTLVNTSNKGPSGKKKGRSKKAHVLAASVEQATQNFLEKGEQIAKESQDLKEELVAAVEDVRKQGETMRVASSEFADDPCSSVKRGTMVRAARALLSAVTRLLILADMADVMRLLSHLKIVEEALEAVKNATNEQDLANRFKEFGKEMVKLNYVAARRQQELKDPHCRDEMAAARGALKKNATMLYTASQAFLRHPDVAATRANRDYVFKQVQEAIAGISSAAQATSPTDEAKGHTGIGELAAALNEFDNKIILDPMTFSEARFRPSLEERLESIISGAALMADSSCTRDDRRERIVAECNAVRQALQDLLSEYMNNVVRMRPSTMFYIPILILPELMK
ncbi:Catenin Alpha-2 [Manis pentadactyla]|nr:Catenin Alpha-2 [Manis pentadactyla]